MSIQVNPQMAQISADQNPSASASSADAPKPLVFEAMPLVVVTYVALQEGFAQLAPCALYNVVAGEIADLVGSTVTLQSLHAKGYRIEERRAA